MGTRLIQSETSDIAFIFMAAISSIDGAPGQLDDVLTSGSYVSSLRFTRRGVPSGSAIVCDVVVAVDVGWMACLL